MPESLMMRIARDLIPPVLMRFTEKRENPVVEDPNVLFEGNDSAFKEIVSKVEVYAEYGMGRSTIWVLRNTQARVIAVDSNAKWVRLVLDETSSPPQLDATHIDLGQVGDWGRPVDYSRREHFREYTDSIWQKQFSPQAVLIDGRFRVCCFLTALNYAAEGTTLIFDDYANRPHYHLVEEFLSPVRTCGRQAIFKVPAKEDLDLPRVAEYIERFRYVME